MAIVHLPNVLTKITKQTIYHSSANTISELIAAMTIEFPELNPYLLSPSRNINAFMNIYVNQQDIRTLNKENTILQANDIVSFIPAMAGG